MDRKRCLTIYHDAVPYRFSGVAEAAYNNFKIMTAPGGNRNDSFMAPGYPFALQIEPSNMCNLRCPLCPVGRNELNRKPRNMTPAEFASIIDDLEQYLLLLVLWDWGEPFMNPGLPAMVKYAHERGIKTVTSTNAQFLDKEEYLAELLRSGLGCLIIAIDSLDEENYAGYRKNGSLNHAITGLEKTIALKKRLGSKTRIHLRMVVMRKNEREIHAMRNLARAMSVDIFTVKTVNPSCGPTSFDSDIVPVDENLRRYLYRDGSFERVRRPVLRCDKPWHLCNIHSNGAIVPCFYDYDASMKIGNVFETPLSTIWNGTPFRKLREALRTAPGSLPKCKTCGNNFELSQTGVILDSASLYRNRTEQARIMLKKYARHRIALTALSLFDRGGAVGI